jgi:hypothetical protein
LELCFAEDVSRFGKKSIISLLLFLIAMILFLWSPNHYLYDSKYSLLMDEAIIHHGSPDMIRYVKQRFTPLRPNHGYTYTLDLIDGRLLYIYPWGSSLLSLPEVALFNLTGFEVASDGHYNDNNENRMQAIIAAFVCAGVVLILFEAASSCLTLGWSLVIALVAGFGTPIWSTASRSLWPQTWSLVPISLAILLLLKEKPRPVWLGSLVALALFVRPQTMPAVTMITLYVLLEFRPRLFLYYAVAAFAWTAVFTTVMWHFFGGYLPPVYSTSVAQVGLSVWKTIPVRIDGLLFSPSRGLLVFVPVILFPLYLTVRYWRHLAHRRLAIVGLLVIVLQVAMTACWGDWWGGWSYGPRLLLETLPWFVLLTILGVRNLLKEQRRYQYSAVIVGALALSGLSIAINGVGAWSTAAMNWNGSPTNIDQNPERLWDWHHPQFLAWRELPPAAPQTWDRRRRFEN